MKAFAVDKLIVTLFSQWYFLKESSESLAVGIMRSTHSLIHHFETVPNSKKLQTTTKIRLLKDFKIHIALKTLWKKVKLLHLSNFTFFHNV